jgi:uncharacterized RDD family membrane protein YckC
MQDHVASRSERLAAYFLEVLLALPFGLVGGVLGYQVGRTYALHRPAAPSLVFALALTMLCLITLSIIQIYWLATRGQTLGKHWMKIRIVRLDGSNPGFLGAVVLRGFIPGLIYVVLARTIGRGAASLFLLVDLLAIFGAEHRCLHDLIAGTKVVRVASPAPGAAVEPPALG